jgi:UDP-GlcNAc:undecaprenyl-phosphate GlcNAc-1-phosphate transferase
MFLSALAAFLWGFSATPISIRLAHSFRLLDSPGGRKRHQGVVPRGAGIVLWLGYLFWSLLSEGGDLRVASLATGATAVFLIGYADDMHSLPPALRFGLHFAAAIWAVLPIPVPFFERCLLLFWVAGVTNAYNLIDGMDGLALGLALVTACAAMSMGDPAAWLPFAGMIAGVLFWNFPVARTFLGDGGSTLLGYVCSAQLSWDLASRVNALGGLSLSLVLLLLGGVPVLDTLFAMVRRILSGHSPFLPDRGHAHHRLLDGGCSKGRTLSILAGCHALLLAAGILLSGGIAGG